MTFDFRLLGENGAEVGREVDDEWRDWLGRLPLELAVHDRGALVPRPPDLDQARVEIHDPIEGNAGPLVPAALRAVRKGGRVVCAGIHMSDIPSFPYDLLWQERQLVSVANLTRQDGLDFLKIAPQAGIQTETTAFPLVEANDVLTKLRTGQLLGAAVLKP